MLNEYHNLKIAYHILNIKSLPELEEKINNLLLRFVYIEPKEFDH